ncbi:MAG: SDR family oxidoreductase [Granulosicoccaceae bacterium]
MKDSVVLVTGASRGIGAATARLAASRGYAVLVNYARAEAEAQQLVDEITYAGGKAKAIGADVSCEADVRQLFDFAETLGELSALVNNAGVLEQQMSLREMSVERWQRVFAVNVIGSMLCAREALRRWSDAPDIDANRSIVNVSSMAASLGGPFEYVDYAASKGAIDSLTKGLAVEVAQWGIRVNAVRPGVIKTGIHASGGEPGRVDRVAAAVPMRRGGEPEEVAQSILWLLSREASYVTGSTLDVSGGR